MRLCPPNVLCLILLVLTSIHLKRFTIPVSVGVSGTVNGRSASSPTGNSAGNTGSFPTKGNMEKTKANSSRSQKSSQDLRQLHQKTIQKTKEKVNTGLAKVHCMKTLFTLLLILFSNSVKECVLFIFI